MPNTTRVGGGHNRRDISYHNDDDGENIEEEDVELQKTLSFIRCKPSLVKSNRESDVVRSTSLTHQGFNNKNMLNTNKSLALNSRHKPGAGGMFGHLRDMDKNFYPEAYQDNYLYELLSSYERQIAGTKTAEDKEELVSLNIHVHFTCGVDFQIVTSEPSKQNEPASSNYFVVGRLKL